MVPFLLLSWFYRCSFRHLFGVYFSVFYLILKEQNKLFWAVLCLCVCIFFCISYGLNGFSCFLLDTSWPRTKFPHIRFTVIFNLDTFVLTKIRCSGLSLIRGKVWHWPPLRSGPRRPGLLQSGLRRTCRWWWSTWSLHCGRCGWGELCRGCLPSPCVPPCGLCRCGSVGRWAPRTQSGWVPPPS